MKTVVVDYGMGNLRSVAKALECVAEKASVLISDQADVIRSADRVVVPGQGAMNDCMHELNTRKLHDVVMEASRNKPFLGICVGMQMLLEHSEEGNTYGLGILKGEVLRFPADMQTNGTRLKVPHMGWNEVQFESTNTAGHPHALFDRIEHDSRFYFVHSYYCAPRDNAEVAATTQYGLPFACAVARDNIFATQFHPEKSAQAGLQLLANFMQWNPR